MKEKEIAQKVLEIFGKQKVELRIGLQLAEEGYGFYVEELVNGKYKRTPNAKKIENDEELLDALCDVVSGKFNLFKRGLTWEDVDWAYYTITQNGILTHLELHGDGK